MHIVNVTWRPAENIAFEHGVLSWTGAEESKFTHLSPGDKLSWTIVGPRMCIGSRNKSGRLVLCPEHIVSNPGRARCSSCAAIDSMDPCIRCTGRICNASEERRTRCEETDYVVYLAVFNDQTLKIGVSTTNRVKTRWVEQGADFAAVLAEIRGGRAARRLEDLIGRRRGATKQVRTQRKISSLMTQLDLTEAEELAKRFISSLQEVLPEREVQLEDLSMYYNLDSLTARPLPWRKRSEPMDGMQLLGDVVGMKGSLLVTRIGSAFAVANLRQLVGYTVDSDSPVRMVTQSGLLDYI
ncbi:MAG: DUF2797 domain-containing protein [Candidatus Thorarchaeota archaeon]|nr:DUF2797 domain-containing protein [Candidatus Thorarchaeota archaeon]